MGCGSSKKVFRANSLQKKLNRPFPLVLEDLLLTNSHTQFVALICKTDNVATKFFPTEQENTVPFISKDNEGERLMSVESHVSVNLDMQSGILSKEKLSEKCKDAEENKLEDKTEIINTWELMEGLDDGETYHVSKKIETETDMLSSNYGDICKELMDKSPPTRISKSLESFHTVEQYDDISSRNKKPLWDRNSKRHLYYLGHDHFNKFRSTSLARPSSCTRLSLKGRNMAPVVIDWKEDSMDENGSTIEFPVLQPSFDLRDMKDNANSQDNNDIQLTVAENNNGIAHTVSENNGSQDLRDMKDDANSQNNNNIQLTVEENNNGIAHTVSENNGSQDLRDMKDDANSQDNNDIQLTVAENNNGIAQTVSENNGSQERIHCVDVNLRNTDMVERTSEKDQSIEKKSSKRRMQERAKINDLGGIIIPSTPDFSAIGSLKEWLHDGEHLSSPGEFAIPRFGYSGFGDIWSKLNVSGNFGQSSSDEAELETYIFPVSSIDDKFANNGESSINSDSAIKTKQWGRPPFDQELLNSLEKDLEQLSQEEQHLLKQIDGNSKMLCGMLCAKDKEDGRQDSSGTPTEDTYTESTCPYNEEDFFIQAPWILEIPQKVLSTPNS